MGQDINLTGRDGDFAAYVAKVDAANAPGLVVIQEIFGVNPYIRETADWFAGQGFTTICPDLFWRQEPGVQLSAVTERDKAIALMGAYDFSDGVSDISICVNWLRENGASRVGTSGYCMGGTLAYLSAVDCPVDCAIGYYAVRIPAYLDRASEIKAPLLLHVAELDSHATPDIVAQMSETLAPMDQVRYMIHAGADHGFCRPGGAVYNEKTARVANAATVEWLNMHLRG